MPLIFSPGEVEVRPLNVDAIVYTTAQKVADLLDVGPQEPVLVAQDSTSTAVFVTGADYRDIGFSAGDVISIYSDADPLGLERTITTVATNSPGVQLNFADSITHANYQLADNAYVQNKASFTDGKPRGVTKAKVDALILRAQDRIDNVTHNAWRPYLVTGEYINFDTYKPYRRRYYTDYVGTTPLLFRNIQQMLRIELWQGDDYRELAAAEARIEIIDYSALGSDSVYLCPGAEGIATLAVGTSTSQWRNDFDNLTTAQQLADLINEDARTGKAAVAFSPAITLEDASATTGTVGVNVNDEFLASANSDYGSGKLKITSTRKAGGGSTTTIAVTDLTNISLSQTTTETTTSTSVTPVSPTPLNVVSTAGFADKGLLMVGSGTSVEVLRYTGTTATSFTGCVNVSGTPLTTLASAGTTVFQHRFSTDLGFISGNSGDKARLKDWWLDSEMGIIYFNNSYPFFEWNAVKVAYIYGERYLEKAIEDAATKMVAAELLMSDDRSVLIPEGTQNVDLASKIQLWRQEAEKILTRYKEVMVFD